MDLKNLKDDDLKAKLQAVDKKTYIKFGIGFGAIILFLIIYYSILNPMVESRKVTYADKMLKQKETSIGNIPILIAASACAMFLHAGSTLP